MPDSSAEAGSIAPFSLTHRGKKRPMGANENRMTVLKILLDTVEFRVQVKLFKKLIDRCITLDKANK